MIFNCGPEDTDLISGLVFDFGGAPGDPQTDILIKYGNNQTFENLSLEGVENIYDFYYEDNIGWAILFYQSCEIQCNKKIINIDVGGVGAGGKGGARVINPGNSNYINGGGGGSGGQRIAIENELLLKRGNYSINIGLGASTTTEGKQTSLINSNDITFLLAYGGINGNGNEAGKKENDDTYSAGGKGGTIAYGGGTSGNGWDEGEDGGAGSSGKALFQTSFWLNNQDNPKVGAGGGGGNADGLYGFRGAGSDGTPGHDFGGGGHGQNGNAASPYSSAQNGTNGLLIIRGHL